MKTNHSSKYNEMFLGFLQNKMIFRTFHGLPRNVFNVPMMSVKRPDVYNLYNTFWKHYECAYNVPNGLWQSVPLEDLRGTLQMSQICSLLLHIRLTHGEEPKGTYSTNQYYSPDWQCKCGPVLRWLQSSGCSLLSTHRLGISQQADR